MKKYIVSVLTVLILLIASAVPFTTAYAAERLCISQIKIESGSGAAEKLESEGYTVLYQNLNPLGGERIYLGYKLGAKSFTGLVVSSELKSSISVNSVNYTPVSSLNLNKGTGGKPVYLYGTTDSKAGSGIVALTYAKDSKDGSVNMLEKFNDGSVPVRTADGQAADFDEGIEERDLYFFTVHENACLPYVSELKTVNVSSGEDAFKKIIASGCNYFNTEPVAQSDGTSTYLCCNRTADAAEAVRFTAISDNAEIDGITYLSAGSFQLNGKGVSLYYTKDKTVGNPVSEITKGSISNEGFTMGDWAKAYFSGTSSSALSNIYSEEAYNTLIESTQEYTQLKIKNTLSGTDTGLYMILSAKGLENRDAEARVVTLPSQQQDENAEMQRDTEITGIEKELTSSTSETTKEELNAYGSSIGGGSFTAIAVLAAIAVIAALSFAIIKGRKKTDN